MAERFPEHIALAPDPSTRRGADGRTFLGGSPLRLLRFTEAGAAAADRVLAGGPVPAGGAEALVARRLLDAGLAHPRPLAAPELAVSVVVPVRDDVAGVAALLDRLPPRLGEVVVVDDGSADPEALAAAVGARATVRRHERSLGPGAARDTGWRTTSGDVVVFVDADVTPGDGWLEPLLAHLLDPAVGVVAPRVRSRPGSTLLERYERHRSPLDLGPTEARVVPRSRVAYVPTAALVCRRAVLEALGGFDASMRLGEDVDLVWRAVEAGWTVRYEPRSEVVHRPRPTWAAWARQRRGYGSAAAALDRRHPGAVAPVELNAWSLAAWALAALGGRRGAAAGTAVAVGSSLALAPKLRGRVDDPVPTALRLGGLGTLHAGTWLARAVWRAWLPVALVAGLRSRRVRAAAAVAAVVPAVLDRRDAARTGPVGVDPVRWVLVHAADQAAYAAGVWRGVLAERSARCLLPRLSGIPGLVGKSGSPRDGG
ncbi:MAG: mycofactocin biosynthesis glycosyltransferase MftF [Acidimicrobiia bacterium]